MTETASLLRLMSWLSPVFPTGGFAYSAGLEQAVHDGHVTNAETLHDWIRAQLSFGSLWNDVVFLASANQRAKDDLSCDDIIELAIAMTNASERLSETIKQGNSFSDAVGTWIDENHRLPPKTPLPIHIGWAGGHSRIKAEDCVAAYLHAFASNQLQAAIRLSVIGQNASAKLLGQLEPSIVQAAQKAASSTLEDLGTCTFLADIAAMKHETLQPRLFLS